MLDMQPTPDRAPLGTGAAAQSWENEGGSPAAGRSAQASETRAKRAEAPASQPTSAALDSKQDQEMVATSSDGAPPPRSLRLAGMHWLALAIPAIIVLGVSVWITLSFGVGAAAFGLVLLAALCGAAVPVWGAGLLRGSEERHARIEAHRELTPRA